MYVYVFRVCVAFIVYQNTSQGADNVTTMDKGNASILIRDLLSMGFFLSGCAAEPNVRWKVCSCKMSTMIYSSLMPYE